MAINFPTSLDVFTDPTASDQLNLPSHSGQHTDLNNAVEALEAKVGADSSAVTTSHDYKIAQLEARNTAGLVLVSRTTIGTAVSSVTVSGAFSSDYDNYRLIVRGVVPSVNTGLTIQFGAVTTGYTWAAWLANYAGSGLGSGASSATYSRIGAIDPGNIGGISVDIYGPNLANKTVVASLGFYGATGTTGGIYLVAGLESGSSQHTAFTLSPTAGTLTGGTIDVYGYVKS